ncbi:alpha/beta-hydrolase [Macroventuria anomochaeta]|uniref:Alpha/beta-hydrolase n=1 Tax=Macroventuria anomochaeta TaxID=301207 RepID=A0ACB6RYW8_9PLEO|nr:alpha/beta-hydrolase [Macroventuria anomochaeta]KAF2626139.1 alpha/beta-hydrolase [Macroventuria anomochaeta]
MPDFTLETPHGIISITDTGLKNPSPALLLLHGNSSSSRIFRHMLTSPTLCSQHRLIAFDLPGHGASSNAPHPAKSYTMSGYADLAVYILEHLSIESVVVLGWSLGGHVALEMVPVLKRASERGSRIVELKGIMLTGTPPALGAENCAKGFKIPTNPDEGEENLMGKVHWTNEQAEAIARNSAPGGHEELFEDWMLNDAIRTDGRARMMMFEAFVEGRGVDQVGVVEGEDVLIAVVNGADEPFINLDYIDELRWKKLWRGECVRLQGRKHAPFWEDIKGFEKLLLEFLKDCAAEE